MKLPFRTVTRLLLNLAIALPFGLGLLGCDGEPGVNGLDAPFQDRIGPDVTLVEPAAFEEIYGQTVLLRAKVDGDTTDLARVQFFVNGRAEVSGDSAVVMFAPWEYVWDFAEAGTGYGALTVTAAAWDTAGNKVMAPARTVFRPELTGTRTLDDLGHAGVGSHLPIPAAYTALNDSGGIDTVLVDVLAGRFTAPAECRLIAMEAYFVYRPEEYPRQSPWVALIYDSPDHASPGAALDSVEVQPGLFDTERWKRVELDELNQGQGLNFEAGDEFFIGIRAADTAAEGEGLVLRTLYERAPSDSVTLERSWWLERVGDETRWSPVAESDPNGYVDHLYLRAVVEFTGVEASQSGGSSNRSIRISE